MVTLAIFMTLSAAAVVPQHETYADFKLAYLQGLGPWELVRSPLQESAAEPKKMKTKEEVH